MTNISSQDFRNIYEKFYAQLRNYLWPYKTLKELADVEVDIYSAFIDIDKLQNDLNKLYTSIKDVFKDDPNLEKSYNLLFELANVEEPTFYSRLNMVQEADPEKAKSIRTIPEEEEEEL